jgi:hypothetical protein
MTEHNRLTTRDIAAAAEHKEEERRERAAAEPSAAKAVAPQTTDDTRAALFPDGEISALRTRWEAIQTGFVDEPKTAVTEADALVAQVVSRLAEVFSHERTVLEQQWDKGDQVSTEELRIALRRYRSFFDRLLSV